VCGPAVIGRESSVARGASIEGSVIGAGSRVRAGARVHDSVLLPGTVVAEGAAVTRSILCEGGGVGEGAEVCGLSVVGPGYEVEPSCRIEGVLLPSSELDEGA